MALQKVTYISEETVIDAENLNAIQDSIIELENKTTTMSPTDLQWPAMAVNSEYLTGLKWDTRDIYSQVVNCGQWTDGESITISVSGISNVVGWMGFCGNYTLPCIVSTGTGIYPINPVEGDTQSTSDGVSLTTDSNVVMPTITTSAGASFTIKMNGSLPAVSVGGESACIIVFYTK